MANVAAAAAYRLSRELAQSRILHRLSAADARSQGGLTHRSVRPVTARRPPQRSRGGGSRLRSGCPSSVHRHAVQPHPAGPALVVRAPAADADPVAVGAHHVGNAPRCSRPHLAWPLASVPAVATALNALQSSTQSDTSVRGRLLTSRRIERIPQPELDRPLLNRSGMWAVQSRLNAALNYLPRCCQWLVERPALCWTPAHRLDTAIRTDSGEPRFVVVDADGFLHPEATAWLQFLTDVGRSPNTVRDYGRRVGWYLSWCTSTMDWRMATLSHLLLWRRTVAASPVSKTNGSSGFRSESTVGLWMVAVRSFYEWADAHSLLCHRCGVPDDRTEVLRPGNRWRGRARGDAPCAGQRSAG